MLDRIEEIDTGAIEELTRIRRDQEVLEDRLRLMAERRDGVSEVVFERVRGDYRCRLDALDAAGAAAQGERAARVRQAASAARRAAAGPRRGAAREGGGRVPQRPRRVRGRRVRAPRRRLRRAGERARRRAGGGGDAARALPRRLPLARGAGGLAEPEPSAARAALAEAPVRRTGSRRRPLIEHRGIRSPALGPPIRRSRSPSRRRR